MSAPKASLDSGDLLRMVAASAEEIAANAAELSRLDAVAGDGDHGVNMTAAMAQAQSLAEALPAATPSEVLGAVATACLEGAGGASGALFGSFFRGVAVGIGKGPEVDAATLAEALAAGLHEVQRVGRAAAGDKTMIDALTPAVDAAMAAARAGHRPGRLLTEAAGAARAGAEATRGLVPRAGRARYAAERSVGTQDPGATAAALILEAWARALGALKGDERGGP
ncbi:MAG: dihydroxyacetone kinase subunit DhaL [Acidimicrobiia bacterium]